MQEITDSELKQAISPTISALTLLFLPTHDSEESGEGGHDDQRDCDGHGTDRSRPGGVNWR